MHYRELEEALLRPYRKDPRNVTHLLEHCEEIVRERNREVEEARRAIFPKVMNHLRNSVDVETV